jgi:hypothetical protein
MAIPSAVVRRYEKDVQKVQELSDAVAQQLITALETTPLTVGTNTITSELASRVEGVSKEDLNELLPPCSRCAQFETSLKLPPTTLQRL